MPKIRIPSPKDRSLIGLLLCQWQEASEEKRSHIVKRIKATRAISRAVDREAAKAAREGRYSLATASRMLASYAGQAQRLMFGMLAEAVKTGDLEVYEPGCYASYEWEYRPRVRSLETVPFNLEVYWEDLNFWLAVKQSRIKFIFPGPSSRPVERINPATVPVGSPTAKAVNPDTESKGSCPAAPR